MLPHHEREQAITRFDLNERYRDVTTIDEEDSLLFGCLG
jgi:hypothetical protein